MNETILVAACGNVNAGDDAFGPLVARALRDRTPPLVEVIDFGMKPAGVLTHIDKRRALIVVDAALEAPDFPVGTLIDIDFYSARRPQLVHDAALSSHGLSMAAELELARRLDMLPPTVLLVAAAVRDTTVGKPASHAVSALVEPAAQRILELAQECLGNADCHARPESTVQ